MPKYSSKYITVTGITRENNGIFTIISFYTVSEEKEKRVIVHTKAIEAYFIDKYKHLGINATNVKDFLTKDDPKYKVELEDVEKFMDNHLYDAAIKEDVQETTKEDI